ncbi:hypothetical protein FD45_GL001498 [Liquorilactobacillus nagelii DSM 13675]|nr:hypothetical protein FD45_GL001498 [Liquorilactobacillus nagelii DSM 13675]
MLKFIGLGLYLSWLFLLLLKLYQAIKNNRLDYKSLFFGNLPWYRNSRNWLLILAILICELTLPLNFFYLLALISGLILIICSYLITHFRLRNFYHSIWLSLLGILLTFISGLILYHL